jgi:electron transport complex protein RnfB
MHTVIAAACTGCELCLAPCPVDCISLAPTGAQSTRGERRSAAAAARLRFDRRTQRRTRDRALSKPATGRGGGKTVDRQAVQRALERARQRLAMRRRSR